MVLFRSSAVFLLPAILLVVLLPAHLAYYDLIGNRNGRYRKFTPLFMGGMDRDVEVARVPAVKRSRSQWEDADNAFVNMLGQHLLRTRIRRSFESLSGSGCGQGVCSCYSKVTRQTFCCDCMTGPCFPSAATIRLRDSGRLLTMGQLKVGDVVTTVVDGAVVGSKVIGFLDRRPSEVAEYLHLTTSEGGSGLMISSGHVIYVQRDNVTNRLETIYANQVAIGDKLVTATAKGTSDIRLVTKIQRKIVNGAFVPLTEEGNLLVNDVLVSCYSSFPHDLSHLILTPIRWFPNWFLSDEEGLNIYVKWLKYAGRAILPEFLLMTPSTSEVAKFQTKKEFYEQVPGIYDTTGGAKVLQCPRISGY